MIKFVDAIVFTAQKRILEYGASTSIAVHMIDKIMPLYL